MSLTDKYSSVYNLAQQLGCDPLSATDSKPVAGLRAFGRVYASRAYGPRFLSEGCHAALGFAERGPAWIALARQ